MGHDKVLARQRALLRFRWKPLTYGIAQDVRNEL